MLLWAKNMSFLPPPASSRPITISWPIILISHTRSLGFGWGFAGWSPAARTGGRTPSVRHASRPAATAHRPSRAVAQPPPPTARSRPAPRRHRPACADAQPTAAQPPPRRAQHAARRPQCLSGCPAWRRLAQPVKQPLGARYARRQPASVRNLLATIPSEHCRINSCMQIRRLCLIVISFALQD
jgi:hypothetical protein